jgi:hypothetical protein
MFLKRILIIMTALINRTLMTMLILNGSHRILCILSSYIIIIVSVKLLQCTNHIIDDRKTLILLYTTITITSAACTTCSGIPPFYYYGGVIISRLCIVQHSMFEVALNLLLNINSFSFYPVHILTWSSFEICNVFADIAMVLSV